MLTIKSSFSFLSRKEATSFNMLIVSESFTETKVVYGVGVGL